MGILRVGGLVFIVVGFETWRLPDKHGRKLHEWLVGIGIVVCFAHYVLETLIVCECPIISRPRTG